MLLYFVVIVHIVVYSVQLILTLLVLIALFFHFMHHLVWITSVHREEVVKGYINKVHLHLFRSPPHRQPSPHYFTFHPHPSPPPEGWNECLKISYSPRKMTKSRTLQWGIIWQLSAAHRGQWLVNAQCYTRLTGGSWWWERLRGQDVMSRSLFFGQSGSQMSARLGNGVHSSHLSHDLGPENLSTTDWTFAYSVNIFNRHIFLLWSYCL